jgi:hypothetical protein
VKKRSGYSTNFSAPNYINVRVVEGPNKIWRLTGIYGEPRWQDKFKTWDKLRELKGVNDMSWVVLGDFNEIAFSHEKDGGTLALRATCKLSKTLLMTAYWSIWAFQGTLLLGNVDACVKDWIGQSQHPLGLCSILERWCNTWHTSGLITGPSC